MTATELLEYVTDDIVIDIMEENGSTVRGRGVTSEGLPYLVFDTICHGGDSPKLYYYSDSKTFMCWTHCGFMRFYDAIQRICGLSNKNLWPAMIYVSEKCGVQLNTEDEEFQSVDHQLIKDQMSFLSKKIRDQGADLNPILPLESAPEIKYDEGILPYFQTIYPKEWVDEGISKKSMQKFEVGYYPYSQYITLPCRNIAGDLIGIRRRALPVYDNGSWVQPPDKYKPLEFGGTLYSFNTGRALYGLYQNQEIIKQKRECVLFEGEKSVMKADTIYGEYPSVAVYGSGVSEWQINALKQLGVNKIFLAFDCDFYENDDVLYKKDPLKLEAYNFSKKRKQKLINNLGMNFYEVYEINNVKRMLKPKDSPIDEGQQVFETLKSKASSRT